jgi:hypothetical protein
MFKLPYKMEFDCDSICVYGLAFEYDDIKHMKIFPEKWICDDGNRNFKIYEHLQFCSSNPWYDCDKDCKMYHVGLVIDSTTPELLLLLKNKLVEQLKIFCEDNKLEYTEPRISSHPNVW